MLLLSVLNAFLRLLTRAIERRSEQHFRFFLRAQRIMMVQQLMEQLMPLLRGLLATLLEFYQERMTELTRAYEERVSSLGAGLLRGIARELCELALANLALTIVVGAVTVGGIYLYIRYCWGRFRWQSRMLEVTREQNRFLEKLCSQLPEKEKGGSDKTD